MRIVDTEYEWVDGFRHLEVVNRVEQRKLSIGTSWTDLVFAVRCSVQRRSTAATIGSDGFRMGFCSSDGKYWDDDQTLFLGCSQAEGETTPYYSGDALAGYASNVRVVSKALATRSTLHTFPNQYSTGDELSGYYTFYYSDYQYYTWLVMRCIKGATATVQFTHTHHSYAPGRYMTIGGMKSLLAGKDFAALGTGLIGASYVPPTHLEKTGLAVANQDTLDSIAIGFHHQSVRLQINAVLVYDWS